MFYLENYGPYRELVENKCMTIHVSSITRNNYKDHYNWILNIMKDGIETEYMRTVFITIVFDNGMDVDLSIPDYWYNLMMWTSNIIAGKKIEPNQLFFDDAITVSNIKKYIDKKFIEPNRKIFDNMTVNNMIDESVHRFADVDLFSMYLCNTINLRDFADLMNKDREFYDILHCDLSNVPIGDVKKVGMDLTNRCVDIIKDSEHCLANFFMAKEGIKPKQFKEFAVNIGTKPDGRGGVYPTTVNTNFLSGGVNDLISYTIESSVGRTAQIIVENNVGESGYFARLLGLNNSDSFLHSDPNYVCDSVNFQVLNVTAEILPRLKNRYYRLKPNGMEYLLKETDTYLIGQTILLRSPMTCASASSGHGICHRCYGELADTNKDINIGKLAAEILSSVLTQMMLSAKHLLESAVKEMRWIPKNDFENLFDIEYNALKVQDGIDLKNHKMIIRNIQVDNEEDNIVNDYNEFVTSFDIQYPNGRIVTIHTEDCDNMYLTFDMCQIVNKAEEIDDDTYVIDLDSLKGSLLFMMQIHNNDLSKTLKMVKDTLDKAEKTTVMNRHEILQSLLEALINGNLNIDSVHAEVILMNQLRSPGDILDVPHWEYPNEPSRVLTLKQALTNNPSVSICLSYQYISKALYSPATFRKTKPSFMDLFFMEKPQMYLNTDNYVKQDEEQIEYNEDGLRKVIKRTKKKENTKYNK